MRAALGDDHSDVAVRGVLCFTRAELPLLRTLTIHLTPTRPQGTGIKPS